MDALAVVELIARLYAVEADARNGGLDPAARWACAGKRVLR
jgi:hypothetical protein